METNTALAQTTDSPEAQGWHDGYNDRPFDCPFAFGTQEYDEYCEGYNEGHWNS